jgi:hypothetical protein
MFKWLRDLFVTCPEERIIVKDLKCVCEEKEEDTMNRTTSGDILLGFGLHEITISLDHKPCTVFLSVQDPADSMAVCHGGINKIGFTILDDGFILYADIQSNTSFIKWTCELV